MSVRTRPRREPFRVVRLAWLFYRIGAMSEMQYRVNFVIQLFSSALALTVGLTVLALVFSHTPELNGWTRPELMAVMGVHIFMGGLIRTFVQPNMNRLMEDVEKGTLDYALTKPEDAQILTSVREIKVWQSVDMVVGIVLMVVAGLQLERGVGPMDGFAFGVVLLLAALIIYSFWLALACLAFWVVRIWETVELFDGIYQAGRWPIGIYPGWLRIGLTYLVPLAFAVTVPARALTSRLGWLAVLGALAFTGGIMVLTRWIWKWGLRRYSGASA